MGTKKQLEAALLDIITACIDSEAAKEIDAGCNGEGPVATAMILMGKTFEGANQEIWGEDYDSLMMADHGDF